MTDCQIYYGNQMHTRIKDGSFRDLWEWPDSQTEASIKDDVKYTVFFDRTEFASESFGRHTKVLAFEETPADIEDALTEIEIKRISIELLCEKVIEYKNLFTKNKLNYEFQKRIHKRQSWRCTCNLP